MKKDADYFGDEELELIFIAKRLRDATRLEEILTEADLDYAVQPDEYLGGIIFKTKRIGAFFYVRSEVRERAVEVLQANNYVPAEG